MSDQSIKSYQDLKVWQDSMSLAESCYRLTRTFPTAERFGLTSQIRRASVSVPANIAEGYGRETTGSFIQSLRTAQGSLKELETHLVLAARVSIVDQATTAPVLLECESIGKMLRAFIRSLQSRNA